MASIIVALVIVLGDHLFKRYIMATLALGETVSLIPGVMQLTYVRNTGMSFGLLRDYQWILMVLIPIVLVALVVLLARRVISEPVQRWSLVAVIAGATGNYIDRIVFGFVVDMFEPIFVRFFVFNLADCFIVCGGIVFVIAYLRAESKAAKAAAPEAGEGSDGD